MKRFVVLGLVMVLLVSLVSGFMITGRVIEDVTGMAEATPLPEVEAQGSEAVIQWLVDQGLQPATTPEPATTTDAPTEFPADVPVAPSSSGFLNILSEAGVTTPEGDVRARTQSTNNDPDALAGLYGSLNEQDRNIMRQAAIDRGWDTPDSWNQFVQGQAAYDSILGNTFEYAAPVGQRGRSVVDWAYNAQQAGELSAAQYINLVNFGNTFSQLEDLTRNAQRDSKGRITSMPGFDDLTIQQQTDFLNNMKKYGLDTDMSKEQKDALDKAKRIAANTLSPTQFFDLVYGAARGGRYIAEQFGVKPFEFSEKMFDSSFGKLLTGEPPFGLCDNNIDKDVTSHGIAFGRGPMTPLIAHIEGERSEVLKEDGSKEYFYRITYGIIAEDEEAPINFNVHLYRNEADTSPTIFIYKGQWKPGEYKGTVTAAGLSGELKYSPNYYEKMCLVTNIERAGNVCNKFADVGSFIPVEATLPAPTTPSTGTGGGAAAPTGGVTNNW